MYEREKVICENLKPMPDIDVEWNSHCPHGRETPTSNINVNSVL